MIACAQVLRTVLVALALAVVFLAGRPAAYGNPSGEVASAAAPGIAEQVRFQADYELDIDGAAITREHAGDPGIDPLAPLPRRHELDFHQSPAGHPEGRARRLPRRLGLVRRADRARPVARARRRRRRRPHHRQHVPRRHPAGGRVRVRMRAREDGNPKRNAQAPAQHPHTTIHAPTSPRDLAARTPSSSSVGSCG